MSTFVRSTILTTPLTRRRSLALAGLGLGACAFRPLTIAARQDGDAIRVTTTVGMIADAIKNIGGELVDVTALMGPGVDPHLYQPSANDIDLLASADIIFYGGLELEGRMTDVLVQMATADIPTIAVGDNTPEDQLREPPEFAGKYDPHIWFSVPLWKIAVDVMRDGLKEHFPDHADDFDANTEAYHEELNALDTYVREQTERVPEDTRVLDTATKSTASRASARPPRPAPETSRISPP
jgi:manganese/zinc/iron transport system substrate-binding protein